MITLKSQSLVDSGSITASAQLCGLLSVLLKSRLYNSEAGKLKPLPRVRRLTVGLTWFML